MYNLLIISAQSINWLDYGTWFSILGVLIMILVMTINKASKKDVNKVKEDMKAQIKNLERTNYHDHKNIREESVNLFKSIQSHIETVAAFVKKE